VTSAPPASPSKGIGAPRGSGYGRAMDKLGLAVVGVVDFFAALVPGVITLAVLLIGLGLVDAVRARGEAGYVLAVIAAYLLGHGLNGLGSLFLDAVYDALYKPEHGWLTRADLPRLWLWPLSALFPHRERADGELAHVQSLLRELRCGNVYQRVRAYLRLAAPSAFVDVERMEAEQKLLRSVCMAVPLVGLAWALAGRGPALGPVELVAVVGVAFVLTLSRFCVVRCKTMDRALLYFEVAQRYPLASPRDA
jgi:hypothetical protein